MNPLNLEDVKDYVNKNIGEFHEHRLKILHDLTLSHLIKKNPYLFRAKNITTAHELIVSTMEAFLSSSEEKLFGDFLEGLAIYIAGITTGGHKSSCPGADLEFQKEETYFLIAIKSGPNWGNSSQLKKLAQDLRDGETRLKQSKHTNNVQTILGICYGKTRTRYSKAGYLKIVGQNFWNFISNNKNLFVEIIEPIGFRAKDHNEQYIQEKGRVINRLVKKFIDEYCDDQGLILWERVIRANSENDDLDKFFN